MQDIWKPVESSWMARLGALGLGVTICAGLLRWMTVGLIAAVICIICCGGIAEMQMRILKNHIEKLEERVKDLEGKGN